MPSSGGDHHEDALRVGGAEENVGLVARLVVKLHEKGVTVGIVGGVRGHIEDGLSPQLLPPELLSLGQRVSGVQRHHQPGLFHGAAGHASWVFRLVLSHVKMMSYSWCSSPAASASVEQR